MIGLDDYDSEQQSSTELPDKPLKEWRRKFEAGTLESSNLMQYFQAASPFFFTIDQTAEYADLGKFLSLIYIYWLVKHIIFGDIVKWRTTAFRNEFR